MTKKLSIKQEAVIADVLKTVKRGEKLSVAKSVEKIYDVKSSKVASVIASQNLANPDFRLTLLEALEERSIIGADSKVEKVLAEGLDATKGVSLVVGHDERGKPILDIEQVADHGTRLEFAKEINKIAGVYAPEKRETKKFSFNLNMSKEEVADRIKALRGELEDV